MFPKNFQKSHKISAQPWKLLHCFPKVPKKTMSVVKARTISRTKLHHRYFFRIFIVQKKSRKDLRYSLFLTDVDSVTYSSEKLVKITAVEIIVWNFTKRYLRHRRFVRYLLKYMFEVFGKNSRRHFWLFNHN